MKSKCAARWKQQRRCVLLGLKMEMRKRGIYSFRDLACLIPKLSVGMGYSGGR